MGLFGTSPHYAILLYNAMIYICISRLNYATTDHEDTGNLTIGGDPVVTER